MTSTAGSPAASIPSLPQQSGRNNTSTVRTSQVSLICTPTGPGTPSLDSATAGTRMASVWAGALLLMEAGTTIRSGASVSLAISLGAGCPITTAAGFLILASAGSGRRVDTDSQAICP